MSLFLFNITKVYGIFFLHNKKKKKCIDKYTTTIIFLLFHFKKQISKIHSYQIVSWYQKQLFYIVLFTVTSIKKKKQTY